MIKTFAVPPGQEPLHAEMTQEETEARQIEEAANLAAQPNLDIMAQIAKLERQQTPRRMREDRKDKTFMDDLDAQIEVLRGQLK